MSIKVLWVCGKRRGEDEAGNPAWDLQAECTRLRGLLDDCHAQIRMQAALLAGRA